MLLTFSSLNGRAQVFIPSTTAEVTFPSVPIGGLASPIAPATSFSIPIDYAQVPGLYCNAHAAIGLSIPSDPPTQTGYVAQTAAWTVSTSTWEDGFVSYGYTNSGGVYIPVDTLNIEGAKHLSAAYMIDEPSGTHAYILVVYTVKISNFKEDPSHPCTWTPAVGSSYAQEYRIYDWPVVSGPATFARIGRVSNISAGTSPSCNYPVCHPNYDPTYRLWYADFAYDGNIVMDVSLDAKRVVFAWTGNGGGVGLSVGSIQPGANAPVLDLSIPSNIAGAAARDPLDVAFRRDTTIGSGGKPYADFIHTLINDGLNQYYVSQNEYNDLKTGSSSFGQIWDDATYTTTTYGPMWTGTNPGGSRSDHMKLDVPDQSPERRWAYTWTDGQSVFLRRFVAPTSLSASSPIGSSSFQIINNGSLTDLRGTPIRGIHGNRNVKAAIAHKENSKNIFLAWLTDATMGAPASMGGSGFNNAISLELQEASPWPAPMVAVSAKDYLHVQATAAGASAREYVALSHHSATTLNNLYNCFTTDDGIDNYLLHKNHNMSMSATWRTTTESALGQNVSAITAGPNPFENALGIKAEGSLTVTLCDIAGRQIAFYKGTEETINSQLSSKATQLTAGTYLLSVQNVAGEKQVFKLNKQ